MYYTDLSPTDSSFTKCKTAKIIEITVNSKTRDARTLAAIQESTLHAVGTVESGHPHSLF